jgi:hypothetical protein
MLVTFRSTATESITMFSDIAVQLLRLMGATGRIPGALDAQDVPAALQTLEAAIEKLKAESHAQTPAPPADNEDRPDDDEAQDREPPIAIATRAIPLLSLMKRAAAAGAEVMWEGR